MVRSHSSHQHSIEPPTPSTRSSRRSRRGGSSSNSKHRYHYEEDASASEEISILSSPQKEYHPRRPASTKARKDDDDTGFFSGRSSRFSSSSSSARLASRNYGDETTTTTTSPTQSQARRSKSKSRSHRHRHGRSKSRSRHHHRDADDSSSLGTNSILANHSKHTTATSGSPSKRSHHGRGGGGVSNHDWMIAEVTNNDRPTEERYDEEERERDVSEPEDEEVVEQRHPSPSLSHHRSRNRHRSRSRGRSGRPKSSSRQHPRDEEAGDDEVRQAVSQSRSRSEGPTTTRKAHRSKSKTRTPRGKSMDRSMGSRSSRFSHNDYYSTTTTPRDPEEHRPIQKVDTLRSNSTRMTSTPRDDSSRTRQSSHRTRRSSNSHHSSLLSEEYDNVIVSNVNNKRGTRTRSKSKSVRSRKLVVPEPDNSDDDDNYDDEVANHKAADEVVSYASSIEDSTGAGEDDDDNPDKDDAKASEDDSYVTRMALRKKKFWDDDSSADKTSSRRSISSWTTNTNTRGDESRPDEEGEAATKPKRRDKDNAADGKSRSSRFSHSTKSTTDSTDDNNNRSITTKNKKKTYSLKQLRWTEQETDNLLLQLEFFGDHLNREIHRFSKKSVEQLLNSIQAVVEKDSLRRDDPLLQNLSKTLHAVRVVDLDKLLRFMRENHKAGDMVQDKEVLLLCGPTGSGKTTTLHYMAGTTLEEVEENGFFHLQPVKFPQQELSNYETSSCRKNVTRHLQAAKVQLEGSNKEKEIVICDTPGLGKFESVEEEISNGIGMIAELQRAKKVYPVLTLSRETLGSRFGNLMEIINAMTGQYVIESKHDLQSLNYVFTKYESKHRTKICKQISVLEKVPPEIKEEDRSIFKAFVKDIIKKTTPKATLALPVEDDPKKMLQELWEAVSKRDGKELIAPYASKSATQKFKLQLQMTVHDFTNLLAKGDYDLALHRMGQLEELGDILPEAKECLEKAREQGVRHVILISDLVKEMVDEQDYVSAFFRMRQLFKLEKVLPEAKHCHDRTVKKIRKRLNKTIEGGDLTLALSKLETLRDISKDIPEAREIVKQGFDSILKQLKVMMDQKEYHKALSQIHELSKITKDYPEARDCVWHGLNALTDIVAKSADEWEFDEMLQILLKVSHVTEDFPQAKECVQLGFDHLKKLSVEHLEAKNYSRFISEVKQLGELTHSLPDASTFYGRGKYVLNDIYAEIINKNDFDTAVEALVNLQNLGEVQSEALECIRTGVEILLQRAVTTIDISNSSMGTARMQKLGQLLPALPMGDSCIKQGLKPLADVVHKATRTLDFSDAVRFLTDLYEITQTFPEVKSAVELGFESLLQKTATELADNYRDSLERLDQLSKVARTLSISNESVQKGAGDLHDAVINAVRTLPDDDAIDLLQHLNKLVDMHPEFPRAVAGGLEELFQKAATSVNDRHHSKALKQIEAVGDLKLRLFVPDECIQRGLKEFSITVNNNLRYMDFSYADDFIQQLFKISVSFPEVTDCVKLGMHVLFQKAVEVFAEKRYTQSVYELKHLADLLQKFSFSEDSASSGLEDLANIIPETMSELDFVTAEDLLKELVELYKTLPETSFCIQAGIDTLLQKLVHQISADHYKEPLSQMKKLSEIAESVANIQVYGRRGLMDLADVVKSHLGKLNFTSAAELIGDLNAIVVIYPEANGALQVVFESLLKRAVKSFQEKHTFQAISQLQQIKSLCESAELDEDTQRVGLENLHAPVTKLLEELELDEAIDLMESLSPLTDPFLQVSDCIDAGVLTIWKNLEEAIDQDDMSTALTLLQKIHSFREVSPMAQKCLQRGLKRMKNIATKAINGEDYMVGVSLSHQLMAFDDASAEQSDTLNLGYSVIREKLEKSIEDRNFSETGVHIRRLVELSEVVPESLAEARRSLVTIMELTEKFAQEKDYSSIISILQNIRTLEQLLPDSTRCIEHGKLMLSKMIEDTIEEHDFMAAISLIEQIHTFADTVPDADEATRSGIDLIGKTLEQPMDKTKFSSVVELIIHLSKSPLPGAGESAKRGLKSFWMRIKRSIEEQDFAIAMELMRNMKKLSSDISEAGDCVQLGFVALRVRLVKTIDQQDYDVAMSLLQQLGTLTEEIPEARECAQFGMEALEEQLDKPIEQGKFISVLSHLKKLNKFDVPDAVEFFRRGFAAISEALSRKVEKAEYDDAVEMMLQLISLGQDRADALDCAKRGIFTFWGKFEEHIAKKDYEGAVVILQFLGKMAHEMSEAEDGVQLGFEVLQEKFEKMIESKDYDSAVRLMQDLSKLAYELPEASSCIQNGFELLRERLVKIIEQQDYSTARHLIGKLEQKLPNNVSDKMGQNDSVESGSLSEHAFMIDGDERVESLKERMLGTIDVQEYDASIDIMLQLSNMEHVVPQAAECLELGYKTLQNHLQESIDQMNCTTVLSLIGTLNRQTHRLPVAGECARSGLKMLRKSVEKRVEQNDYKLAIELMDLLCKLTQELSEAYDFAQQALDFSVRHVITLRDDTASLFEELGEVRDAELFSQMLETAHENIEMVMATEELRNFCNQLNKKKLGLKDTRTLHCAPCLGTTEEFCTAQLKIVAESVSSDFPELIVDHEYITIIAENQDLILPVLNRLWLLNRTLQNCIGAAPVTSAYKDAFQKFFNFLDGVVSSAQEDFQPNMDLKSFEMQVVLLSSLLSGFLEGKNGLLSDERKKLDDLEHRRSRLMLRFEIEVADSLEVLYNYTFPELDDYGFEKRSSYIRTMKISQVQKHREVITAATRSKDLTDMISDNVDLSSAQKTLSTFDKSLERFLEELVSKLEEDREELNAMPKTLASLGAAEFRVDALRKDVHRVIQEISAINRWLPTRIVMDLDTLSTRMYNVQADVRNLTKQIDDMNNTGIGAFFTGIVADYYSCGWPNADNVDDAVLDDSRILESQRSQSHKLG